MIALFASQDQGQTWITGKEGKLPVAFNGKGSINALSPSVGARTHLGEDRRQGGFFASA